MAWNVQEYVGKKPVLSSGSLTIAGGEYTAIITFAGYYYRFEFQYSVESPTAQIIHESGGSVVKFVGNFSPGAAWHWPLFGRWSGRFVELSVEVASFTDGVRPNVYSLRYTFLHGEALPAPPPPMKNMLTGM
jgi:hypothetical protein